jgi:hypothetical protein
MSAILKRATQLMPQAAEMIFALILCKLSDTKDPANSWKPSMTEISKREMNHVLLHHPIASLASCSHVPGPNTVPRIAMVYHLKPWLPPVKHPLYGTTYD